MVLQNIFNTMHFFLDMHYKQIIMGNAGLCNTRQNKQKIGGFMDTSCRLFSSVIDGIDKLKLPCEKDLEEFRTQIKTSKEVDHDDIEKLNKLIDKVKGLKKKLENIKDEALKGQKDLDDKKDYLSKLIAKIEYRQGSIPVVDTVAKTIIRGNKYVDGALIAGGIVFSAATWGVGGVVIGTGLTAFRWFTKSTHEVLESEVNKLKEYEPLKVKEEIELDTTNTKEEIKKIESKSCWKCTDEYTSIAKRLKSNSETLPIGDKISEYIHLIDKRYQYAEKCTKICSEVLKLKHKLIAKIEIAIPFEKESCPTHITSEVMGFDKKEGSQAETDMKNEKRASES